MSKGTVIVLTARVDVALRLQGTCGRQICLTKLELTPRKIRCQIRPKSPHTLIQCGRKVLLVEYQRLRFATKHRKNLCSQNWN